VCDQRILALRLTGLEKKAPRGGRTPTVSGEKLRVIIKVSAYMTLVYEAREAARTIAKVQSLRQAAILYKMSIKLFNLVWKKERY
jgi:hypothetical protein